MAIHAGAVNNLRLTPCALCLHIFINRNFTIQSHFEVSGSSRIHRTEGIEHFLSLTVLCPDTKNVLRFMIIIVLNPGKNEV